MDIKCRKAHLKPDVVVIVATVRALKYHGGAELSELNQENINYLLNGISNLNKHIDNLHELFGMQVIVAINHFVQDTPTEIAALKLAVEQRGSQAIVCKHWANGAAGAAELAHAVVDTLANVPSHFKTVVCRY